MENIQAALFSNDEFHSEEEVFEAGNDMDTEEQVTESLPQSLDHEAADSHSES